MTKEEKQADERQLLIEVSVRYFLDGMTQSQIAKELFLSRPKVSRLLKKAKETGIVSININYASDQTEYIRDELTKRFNINNVRMVKTQSNYSDTLVEIGKYAADVMSNVMFDGMTIGISWGHSVRNTVSQMKKLSYEDIKIVELFGAISYDMGESDILSIGTNLANKIGARFYPIPAPIFVDNKEARDALVKSPIIKHSLEMIDNCDLILTGLGAVETEIPQTLWDIYVKDELKEKILRKGGVGFLCAHFFDQRGEFLDLNINKNIIGIQSDTIGKQKMIVVAGGERKSKAILGALRAGRIDTLISDEDALLKVLELDDKIRK
ncbi:MAG: winged helix-turn-helix transcriptional regulator [Clostridiales bacterium]|nr:winged helix-turn-helix transcriptional regulator [Clostridiales bacterium]